MPGQEPVSGEAPRYKISDEAAFGSAPNVDWQELEVITTILLLFPVLIKILISLIIDLAPDSAWPQDKHHKAKSRLCSRFCRR
jgi:hypothetical protein